MAVQHKNLTASQVHEPKGVSAASQYYYNLALSGANRWTTLHLTTSITASSDTTLELTNLSEYDQLIIQFDDLLTSDVSNVAFQVSSDNGSSYNNSDYHSAANRDGTSSSSSSDTVLFVAPGFIAGYRTGQVIITNFNKPLVSTVKGLVHTNTGANLSGLSSGESIVGLINVATAWNAIKFYTNSGTFTSGDILLEGTRS